MIFDNKWWEEFWSSPEGKLLCELYKERDVTVGDFESAKQSYRTEIPLAFIRAFENGPPEVKE